MLGKAAFEQPVVKLKDVRVRGVGLTGGSLDVLLSVYNPNHYRLDATRLTYQVNLAGDSVHVANGAMDNRFTVNDNDSTVVTHSGVVHLRRHRRGRAEHSEHGRGELSCTGRRDASGPPSAPSRVPYSSTGRFTTTGIGR